MAEPISWQALEVIRDRLLQVAAVAGFHSDLGAGLVTLNPADETTDPAAIHTLVSAEGFTTRPEASGRRMTVSDMDVRVEVAVPFAADGNAALLAHRARADVVMALREGAWRSNEGIRSIDVANTAIVTAPDGVAAVIAQVNLRVGLAESTTPAP